MRAKWAGRYTFEIALRDARIERLMEALRAIAAGEVQQVMAHAARAWEYERRLEETAAVADPATDAAVSARARLEAMMAEYAEQTHQRGLEGSENHVHIFQGDDGAVTFEAVTLFGQTLVRDFMREMNRA